ncbi:MAG: ATP-binding protein [Actinomycetota bacterium]
MAIKMVDREHEVERLRELAASPPAFVVLRGRRRVGKTFLLRFALSGDRVLHLQAEEKPASLQIEAFARECSGLIPGEPPLSFTDWPAAFEFVEQQAKSGGPIVLVLDEFQYLAASQPSLESVIQRFWDRWERSGVKIMVVLSGSALSFMGGLLSSSRPLHGRSGFRPLLLPLTYREAAEFAPSDSSPAALIQRFAVLGGTPQYQKWAGTKSLKEILEKVILPPDAPLHNEPQHLIRQESGIREPGPYFGALEAVASGYSKTTAVAARLGIGQQLASGFLSRLEELGYLAKVTPLEPGNKGRARGYWKVSDPYFRFWFRFVQPNRSRLARGRIKEVADDIRKQLPTFVGPIFEDCCREWVGRYSELGATPLQIGSWWSRRHDVEIDVTGISKNEHLLLGACKWSRSRTGMGTLQELLRAQEHLGARAAHAKLLIFSRSGFSEELLSHAKPPSVSLFAIEDLFN